MVEQNGATHSLAREAAALIELLGQFRLGEGQESVSLENALPGISGGRFLFGRAFSAIRVAQCRSAERLSAQSMMRWPSTAMLLAKAMARKRHQAALFFAVDPCGNGLGYDDLIICYIKMFDNRVELFRQRQRNARHERPVCIVAVSREIPGYSDIVAGHVSINDDAADVTDHYENIRLVRREDSFPDPADKPISQICS
jgi:hypothetical protein